MASISYRLYPDDWEQINPFNSVPSGPSSGCSYLHEPDVWDWFWDLLAPAYELACAFLKLRLRPRTAH